MHPQPQGCQKRQQELELQLLLPQLPLRRRLLLDCRHHHHPHHHSEYDDDNTATGATATTTIYVSSPVFATFYLGLKSYRRRVVLLEDSGNQQHRKSSNFATSPLSLSHSHTHTHTGHEAGHPQPFPASSRLIGLQHKLHVVRRHRALPRYLQSSLKGSWAQ